MVYLNDKHARQLLEALRDELPWGHQVGEALDALASEVQYPTPNGFDVLVRAARPDECERTDGMASTIDGAASVLIGGELAAVTNEYGTCCFRPAQDPDTGKCERIEELVEKVVEVWGDHHQPENTSPDGAARSDLRVLPWRSQFAEPNPATGHSPDVPPAAICAFCDTQIEMVGNHWVHTDSEDRVCGQMSSNHVERFAEPNPGPDWSPRL